MGSLLSRQQTNVRPFGPVAAGAALPVREAAKQETRRKLLEAAGHRFVQDGFLEATTAAIARDAGVAHGTLFLHFPDRDALLLAVVERLLVGLGANLHHACFQASDLESLCRLFLGSLSEHEDLYATLVRDLPRFPLPLKRGVFATFAGITCHFTEVIEQGQAAGILRATPPAVANALFFGTLNHYFLYRDLMTPDGRVVATHGERLLTSFVEMMTLEQGSQTVADRPTEGERDTNSQHGEKGDQNG